MGPGEGMFAQTGRLVNFLKTPAKNSSPPLQSQFPRKKTIKRAVQFSQGFGGASFETTPLKRPNLSEDKFFEPPGSQREWLQQVMFGVFPEVVVGVASGNSVVVTVGNMWSVMGWDC